MQLKLIYFFFLPLFRNQVHADRRENKPKASTTRVDRSQSCKLEKTTDPKVSSYTKQSFLKFCFHLINICIQFLLKYVHSKGFLAF